MKFARSLLIVMVLTALFAFAPAVAAFADVRSTHASCLGFEASALSPPGSNDEAIGGIHDLKLFFDEAFPGVPPGQIYRFIASLHEGSHEACDEAIE